MSFVLEALKRSEQQRQVTSAPNLGSYVLPSRHGIQAKPLGWLAAGAGLLLVAALLGWWLGNRPTAAPTVTEPTVPRVALAAPNTPPAAQPNAATPMPVRVAQAPLSPAPVVAVPAAIAPAAVSPTPTSRPQVMPAPAPQRVYTPPQTVGTPPVKVEPRPAPAPTVTAPILAARQVPAPVAAVPPPPAPVAVSQPVPAPQASVTPPTPMTIALPSLGKPKLAQDSAAHVPATSGEVVSYIELPASVRQALPEMRLSGYMIDNSGRGLVGVNDQLVGEGEEISPGLVVEKIDPNGVVFRFRQYRFRR